MPTSATKEPAPRLGHDRIDPTRYLSANWARLEWERMWRRCWLYAVPAADVASPRSWATFSIGRAEILISRTADGVLSAHYNVCQHRGRRLVDGDRGTTGAFRCPYHAWTYRLDGSLKTIPDREVFSQELDECDLGLPEVQVDTWGGLVWICLDPTAGSLADYLGVIPEHLSCYPLEQYALVREQTAEWSCNWKVAVDAFHESYHNLATHPEMNANTADVNVQIDCYDRHSRFLMPIGAPAPRVRKRDHPNEIQRQMLAMYGADPDDFVGTADEAYLELQRVKRLWALAHGYELDNLAPDQFTDNYHYTIFPNTQIAMMAHEMLLTRHRPHPQDPERMLFDVQEFRLVAPGEPWPDRPEKIEGVGSRYPERPYFLTQDAFNMPAIQAGVRSDGFRGSVLSDLELRIRHFHHVLDQYVAQQR